MKYLITIVVLLVIGGFWLSSTNEEVPPTTSAVPETEEASHTDGMTDEMSDDEVGAMTDEPTEEEVSVKEFTLDSFGFGYSETEIRVKKGDTVTINLTNSAGFHDWVVDEFDAATEKISEGETTSVTFVAGEAGTFEYYCSVGDHREKGMVGTLIVE